jgi:hypothetical protein
VTLPLAVAVLPAIMLLGLAVQTLLLVSRWRVGRTVPVSWRGLLALPRHYLVDVHRVVARDPGPGCC